MRSFRPFVVAAAVMVTAASAVHCSSSGSSSGSGTAAPSSAVIGPGGGTLASSDGNVDITVPAGAVPADVTLTVAPTASPAPGAIGTVYEFGPDGTKFLVPITMKFHYAGFDLGGHAPTDLRVAAFAGGGWQAWPGTSLDPAAKTISGQATHFSNQAVVVQSAAGICYHAAALPYGCASTGGSGSGSGGGGGAPSGSSSGGGSSSGTPGGCPAPPTCAAANPCAPYPESTVSSCTDTASGPDAVCCYAPGQPVCTTMGEGAGCAPSGGGGSSGSGGGTCPPPPTCASTPNKCPSGTTEKSCTNFSTGSSGGFNVTCCYPPGVDPYAGGGSGPGSGGTGGADASVPPSSGGGSGGGGSSSGGPPPTDAGGPPPPDGGPAPSDAGAG